LTNISQIRTGLATNLATIPGLRVSAELPDSPNPPIAIVNLEGIEYDQAMMQGLTLYNFGISVIVGRAAEREMQRKLDTYLQISGSQSVKLAIESDRTLGGVIQDLRVTNSSSIGSIIINDQTYLAAEFTVTVFA
jgi:hypothetical protein